MVSESEARSIASRIQLASGERVVWVDCGFYLMPVTPSHLARHGLRLDAADASRPNVVEEGATGRHREKKRHRSVACYVFPLYSYSSLLSFFFG